MKWIIWKYLTGLRKHIFYRRSLHNFFFLKWNMNHMELGCMWCSNHHFNLLLALLVTQVHHWPKSLFFIINNWHKYQIAPYCLLFLSHCILLLYFYQIVSHIWQTKTNYTVMEDDRFNFVIYWCVMLCHRCNGNKNDDVACHVQWCVMSLYHFC